MLRKTIFIVLPAVIGSGLWYALAPPFDETKAIAEVSKMLDDAKRVNEAVFASKQKEAELRKQLDSARLAESEAKMSGDPAKRREGAEQTKQRKAELQQQAALTRQREAEAEREATAAKQWMEGRGVWSPCARGTAGNAQALTSAEAAKEKMKNDIARVAAGKNCG